MAGSVPVAPLDRVAAPSAGQGTNYTAPLAVLTTLFFMWGFLTCLNDIIIPHLKAVFELNYAKAMLIQFAFFTAYFVDVAAVREDRHAPRLQERDHDRPRHDDGVGCLLFYPAAGVRSYNLFLLALFVLASGITLLQVAANPFVAVLGKPETASSRLTLTQAFNSLGTTIAPQFGSLLILSTAAKSSAQIAQMSPSAADAYRLAEASSVQHPYLALAGRSCCWPSPLRVQASRIEDVTPAADAGAALAIARAPGAIATWCSARWRSSSTSAARSPSAASWSTTSRSRTIGGLTEAAGARLMSLLLGRRDGRPVHRHGRRCACASRARC